MPDTKIEDLRLEVHAATADMAAAAAAHTADVLTRAVAERGTARVVIATGNSQLAFVTALAGYEVPWSRITVFHMDEYVGIDADHPASFRRWIRERIAEPFGPARVEYIDGEATDVDAECLRYEALLRSAPIDLTCMGIGENGHLAFNEPDQADFADPRWVRPITLTPESLHQQVGEGHFPDIASVPPTAISLTIPALLSARTVQVVAPEERKATAVRNTLTLLISPACPSTILRRTPHAILYLDAPSAATSQDLLPTPA
ncbi:glucosamine-6-phosphate deaminase [Kribbella solani]|uniref:glucosamine-6-phosphate deaminase n=1 Tax=Kribbella solani TaxID=236067 RepID=UPI0029A1464B|nr:glucosamine-6-phosphate deaminase [Kribbella solani]MDX3001816.1 glucosamine-6-phosphate deaminase [Kribbella solani]